LAWRNLLSFLRKAGIPAPAAGLPAVPHTADPLAECTIAAHSDGLRGRRVRLGAGGSAG